MLKKTYVGKKIELSNVIRVLGKILLETDRNTLEQKINDFRNIPCFPGKLS